MNFLDAYDVASPATPVPGSQTEQTLNDEVNQVVGQLSKFWGGFRKQSQAAFEAAKKDLTQVVSEAQKEINKLTADTSASTSTQQSGDTSTSPEGRGEEDEDNEKHQEAPEGTRPDASPSSEPSTSTPRTHARTPSQNLFARLQSSLPPNLVSTVQNTVQNTLPEALKQPGTIDFTQLRSTLSSEFQRVQGLTRAQAEEYVHKSESLIREASEFLKDAVKVVPPEEGGTVAPVGTLWDGTDIWMLPEVGLPPSSTSSRKGKGKDTDSTSSGRPSTDGLRAVATRAEALLKQLRHNPDVLKVDPESDEKTKAAYEVWIQNNVSSKEGGISGAEWSGVIEKALSDPIDGQALRATRDTLVPSTLSNDVFWTRYFFRVNQVEQEEERRKALLQRTVDNNEDDFSWEDEDEDGPATAKPTTAEITKKDPSTDLSGSLSTLKVKPESSPTASSPPQESRRQSSEDSYDVVSEQVSSVGDTKIETAEKEKAAQDESDSDWE
ncbi:hypothetical protein K474DRAFT_1626034 [Panus rudis PR-1116 ss-1]|nr:hypothetical protein K474DRAFT_1626034 [Panus rudis PR-1116 ss-1]